MKSESRALEDIINDDHTDDGSWNLTEDCLYSEISGLAELEAYIASTYKQHYAMRGIQAAEVIIAAGMGEDYVLGNIIKYALRYGKKEGYNRKDILKILHYGLILLHIHYLQDSPVLQTNGADED